MADTIRHRAEFRVTEDLLADRFGTDASVLATPILLWWAELACRDLGQLVQPGLSYGVAHEMRHLRPAHLGEQVVIEVELLGTHRNRQYFSVSGRVVAQRDRDLVLIGLHERAVTRNEPTTPTTRSS